MFVLPNDETRRGDLRCLENVVARVVEAPGSSPAGRRLGEAGL